MKTHLWCAVSAGLFALITTLRTSINTTIARLVLLIAGCLIASTVSAGIQRVNLDGSGLTTLLANLTFSPGIALDTEGGQMYWTADPGLQPDRESVRRANLDGSGVTDLVTDLFGPWGVALDVGSDQMYWTNRFADKIQRANLDGSEVTDLVTGLLSEPIGIALDVGGSQMYWTAGDFFGGKIQRANLDGSGGD